MKWLHRRKALDILSLLSLRMEHLNTTPCDVYFSRLATYDLVTDGGCVSPQSGTRLNDEGRGYPSGPPRRPETGEYGPEDTETYPLLRLRPVHRNPTDRSP